MSADAIVGIRGLRKSYTEGGRNLRVLDDVALEVFQGEFLVLLGKSGSGKSTLLNMISGIDKPDSGTITIADTDITALGDTSLTRFRRDNIGIVFQFFNLIPTLTVLENITLPQELRSGRRKLIESRARALLRRIGLPDRADAYPDKLSGGEQQRVAIARALSHEPKLLLADEPTGNLDADNGQQILDLLLELTREAGNTLIMATHNLEMTPIADRVCRLLEGRLYLSERHSSGDASDAVASNNSQRKGSLMPVEPTDDVRPPVDDL